MENYWGKHNHVLQETPGQPRERSPGRLSEWPAAARLTAAVAGMTVQVPDPGRSLQLPRDLHWKLLTLG